MSEHRKPLGIYVHIPFCLKKCYYCDFLSVPIKEETEWVTWYFQALKEEIQEYQEQAGSYAVSSIFLGGGTPTLPSEKWIIQIIEEIQNVFLVEKKAEITIECNPETVNRKKLQAYRETGINRISFGLQSADNRELKRLGRVHTYQRFLESFTAAREVGFSNCNVDLMFGLPGQTLDGWENTVRTAAALAPEHLSAYSLIVEEGTPFFEQRKQGLLSLPEEEEERQMYQKTEQWLEESGYQRYEISNYAKTGWECRHNLIYWSGEDYLGLGLGASSYLNGVRFQNTTDFKSYQKKEKRLEERERGAERLTITNQMEEFLFLGLRKMAGVSKTEFQKRFGYSMDSIHGEVIRKWKKKGLLEEGEDRVWLTRGGIDVSNVILADFLLE